VELFLHIHMYVTVVLLSGKVCECNSATKAFELRYGYDIVGRGTVCTCASKLNFIPMPYGGTSQNVKLKILYNLGISATKQRHPDEMSHVIIDLWYALTCHI